MISHFLDMFIVKMNLINSNKHFLFFIHMCIAQIFTFHQSIFIFGMCSFKTQLAIIKQNRVELNSAFNTLCVFGWALVEKAIKKE